MTNNDTKRGELGSYHVLAEAGTTPLSPSKTSERIDLPQVNSDASFMNIEGPEYRENSTNKSSYNWENASFGGSKNGNLDIGDYRTRNSKNFVSIKYKNSSAIVNESRSKVDVDKADAEFISDATQENAKLIKEATRLLVTRNETLKSTARDSSMERAAKHLLTIGSTTLRIAKCFGNDSTECITEGEEKKNEILRKFFELHSDDTRVRLAHRLNEIGRAAMAKGKELQTGRGVENSDSKLLSEVLFGNEADKKEAKHGKGASQENSQDSGEKVDQNRTKSGVIRGSKGGERQHGIMPSRNNHLTATGKTPAVIGGNRAVVNKTTSNASQVATVGPSEKSRQEDKVEESYASHLQRALQNMVPTYHRTALCSHGHRHKDVIPRYGLHSGLIELHGIVKNLDRCIKYCCASHTCDLAMLVKKECFTITCKSELHCQFVTNRGHRRTEAVRIYRGKLKHKARLQTGYETGSSRRPVNNTVAQSKTATSDQREANAKEHFNTTHLVVDINLPNSSVIPTTEKSSRFTTRWFHKSAKSIPFYNPDRGHKDRDEVPGVRSKLKTSEHFNLTEEMGHNLRPIGARVNKSELETRNSSEEHKLKHSHYNLIPANKSLLHSNKLMLTISDKPDNRKTALLSKNISKNFLNAVNIPLKSENRGSQNPLYNASFLLKFYKKSQDRIENFENVLFPWNNTVISNQTDATLPLTKEGADEGDIAQSKSKRPKVVGRKRHHRRMKLRAKGKKHSKKGDSINGAPNRSVAKGFRAMIKTFMKPHPASKLEFDNLLQTEAGHNYLGEDTNRMNNTVSSSNGKSGLIDRPQIEFLGPDVLSKKKNLTLLNHRHETLADGDKNDDFNVERTQTLIEALRPMTAKLLPGLVFVNKTENQVDNTTMDFVKTVSGSDDLAAAHARQSVAKTLLAVSGDKRGMLSNGNVEQHGKLKSRKLALQGYKATLAPLAKPLSPSLRIAIDRNSGSFSNTTTSRPDSFGKYLKISSQNETLNEKTGRNHSKVLHEKLGNGNFELETALVTPPKIEMEGPKIASFKSLQMQNSSEMTEHVAHDRWSVQASISDSHKYPRNSTVYSQRNSNRPTARNSPSPTSTQRFKEIIQSIDRSLTTTKSTSKQLLSDATVNLKKLAKGQQNSFKNQSSTGELSLKLDLVGKEKNVLQKNSLINGSVLFESKNLTKNAIEPTARYLIKSQGDDHHKNDYTNIKHHKMAVGFSTKGKIADHPTGVIQKQRTEKNFANFKPRNSSQQKSFFPFSIPIPSHRIFRGSANAEDRKSTAFSTTKQSTRIFWPIGSSVSLKNVSQRTGNQSPNNTQATGTIPSSRSARLKTTTLNQPTNKTQKKTSATPISHQPGESTNMKAEKFGDRNYLNASHVSIHQNHTKFADGAKLPGIARVDAVMSAQDVNIARDQHTHSKLFTKVSLPSTHHEPGSVVGHTKAEQAGFRELTALSIRNRTVSKHLENSRVEIDKGEFDIDSNITEVSSTKFIKGHGKGHGVNGNEYSPLSVVHQNTTSVHKNSSDMKHATSISAGNQNVTRNTKQHLKQKLIQPMESWIPNTTGQRGPRYHQLYLQQTYKAKADNNMPKSDTGTVNTFNELVGNMTKNTTTIPLPLQENMTDYSNKDLNRTLLVEYPRPTESKTGISPATHPPSLNYSSFKTGSQKQGQSLRNITISKTIFFSSQEKTSYVAENESSQALSGHAQNVSSTHKASVYKQSNFTSEMEAIPAELSLEDNKKLQGNKTSNKHLSSNMSDSQEFGNKEYFSSSEGKIEVKLHTTPSHRSPVEKQKYTQNDMSNNIRENLVGSKVTSANHSYIGINHTKSYTTEDKNHTWHGSNHVSQNVHNNSTGKILPTNRVGHKSTMNGKFSPKYTHWPQEYLTWRNYKHPTSKIALHHLKPNSSTFDLFSHNRLFPKNVPGQSPRWPQYRNPAHITTGNVSSRQYQQTKLLFDNRSETTNTSSSFNNTVKEEGIVLVDNTTKSTGNDSRNPDNSTRTTALTSNNTTRATTPYGNHYKSKQFKDIKELNASSTKSYRPPRNRTVDLGIAIKNTTSSFGHNLTIVNVTSFGNQNITTAHEKMVHIGPKPVNVQTEYSKLNYTAYASPYSHVMLNHSHIKTTNGSKRVFSSNLNATSNSQLARSQQKMANGVERTVLNLATNSNKTERFLDVVHKKSKPDLTIKVHYRLGKNGNMKHRHPSSNQTAGSSRRKTPLTIRVYYKPGHHMGKVRPHKSVKPKPKNKTLKTPETFRVFYNPGRYAHPDKVTFGSVKHTRNKTKSAQLTELYGIKKLYMQENIGNQHSATHPESFLDKSQTGYLSHDAAESAAKAVPIENTHASVETQSPPIQTQNKERPDISNHASTTETTSPNKFIFYIPQESLVSKAPQNSDYLPQKAKTAKTSTGAKKSFHRNNSGGDISVTPKHSFHRKKPDQHHCNLLGIYTDKVLHDGAKAGNFYPVLFVKDPVHCHKKCCADARCNFAMFYRDFCYLIECFSKSSCRLVNSKTVTRHPHLLAKIREPEIRSLSRVYKFPPEIGMAHVPTMFIRPKSAQSVAGEKRQPKSQKEALLDLFHSLLNRLENKHPTSKREHIKDEPRFGFAEKGSNVISSNASYNSSHRPNTIHITPHQSTARNKQWPLFAKPFFGMPLHRSVAHKDSQSSSNSEDTYLTDYLNQTFANVSKPFRPTFPSRVQFSTVKSTPKHPTLHSALSGLSPSAIKKIVSELRNRLLQVNLKLRDVLPELRYVMSHSRSEFTSASNISSTIFGAIKELRAKELLQKVSKISEQSEVPSAHNVSRIHHKIEPTIKISSTLDSPLKEKQTKKQELNASKTAEQLISSVKENGNSSIDRNSRLTCIITSVRGGATLYGGPRSGVFTSHGGGLTLNECVERCCTADNCHVALLVAGHCYTVKCYTAGLCRIVPVKRAGHYLMTVAYVRRRVTYSTGVQGTLHTAIGDTALPLNAIVCSESVVYEGYTLKGGYDAGHFTYKGEVGTLTDCIELCCNANFCDLVFMVTNQCYLVYCYGKDGCQHVKAYHGVLYRTRIAYLHSRNKIIPPWAPKDIGLRSAINGKQTSVVHAGSNAHNGRPTSSALKLRFPPTSARIHFPANVQSIALVTENRSVQSCLRAKVLSQMTMAEGHRSGKLLFRGRKENDKDCLKDCCFNADCNIALIVRDYCFNVVCKSKSACRPVRVIKSKHSVRLAVIRTSIAHVKGMLIYHLLF